MATVVRSTALRAGGACVRCRKGKTKCVYENGRAPCKNCAKGMHECYLPSESMSHGGHGSSQGGGSPARVSQRPRDSLPASDRTGSIPNKVADRPATSTSLVSRQPLSVLDLDMRDAEMVADVEKTINKTVPACVAFHKPSFIQKLKNAELEPVIFYALVTIAARKSPHIARKHRIQHPAGHGGHSNEGAAEYYATKTMNLVMKGLEQPSLADVQAMCLLVIHEWGNRNAVRAYVYLGQAARMAQMYRVVHGHVRHTEPEQFLVDESLHRTLWLIYILDCFLTSSPGRHPALSGYDMADVSLPCLDMNYHFGSPVVVRTIEGVAPADVDPSTLGEVGEFGYLVLATKAWRNVVELITVADDEPLSAEQCQSLEQLLENIRKSLPLHFVDKPGQINIHITMGSGPTYAMIHSLLHCASIFMDRRRILDLVTADDFSLDTGRLSPQVEALVDHIYASCHSIIQLLLALKHGGDRESYWCLPSFMFFAAFTAGSTVAYLQLKGLLPDGVQDTAISMVKDTEGIMIDGSTIWNLVLPWQRHIIVMVKVLQQLKEAHEAQKALDAPGDSTRERSKAPQEGSPSIKDDISNPPTDGNADAMDYLPSQPPASDTASHAVEDGRPPSEPPVHRPPGVTTINAGSADSAGSSTPAAPAAPSPRTGADFESPGPPASSASVMDVSADPALPDSASDPAPDPASRVKLFERTAAELCSAFETQLLDLDDLAAFMGGGVTQS